MGRFFIIFTIVATLIAFTMSAEAADDKPAPPAPAGGITNINMCKGGSIELNAGDGFDSYLWSISGATLTPLYGTVSDQKIVVAPVSDTTYILQTTKKTATGKTTTITKNVLPYHVSVKKPTHPAITVEPGTKVTKGQHVKLTASGEGFTNYIWTYREVTKKKDGDNEVTEIEDQPEKETGYTLTATDINGCTSENTVTVTIAPSKDRFSYRFLYGVEVSQSDSSFSNGTSYLEFTANTLWAKAPTSSPDGKYVTSNPLLPTNTFVVLRLSEIDVNDPAAASGTDPQLPQRSFTGIIGMEYRWWVTHGTNSTLFAGPVFKAGAQSVRQEIDSKNIFRFWSAGFRLGQHDNVTNVNHNPELKSYFDVSVGRYENLRFDKTKLVLEGFIEPTEYPVFLSMAGIMRLTAKDDNGHDDFRIRAGLNIKLDLLLKAIFGVLTPPGSSTE